MTWTYSDEYYKSYTRDTWNESAGEYGPVAANLDLYNADILKAAAAQPGARVLDVACGLGEPTLSLATAVGPKGSVVGIDLSEKMVALARERAKVLRLPNATFETMDAEALALPDQSFDLVTCRFGLQIVTNPDKAIAEARRVLKPGGRFAATVWGPGSKCPALHVIIGPMLEHAEPDESGYLPTPYEMGGPNELVDILGKAGFSQARETRVTHEHRYRDADDFLHAILKGTPIGHSLSEEDADVQREVLAKTRANCEKYRTPEGLRLPGEAVVVHAVR